MRRLGDGMDPGQEPLGKLVGLALADLIGRYRHECIVAAFGHNSDGDAPDGPGEFHPPRQLCAQRQGRSEELPGAG
jgi:hypothetical protein